MKLTITAEEMAKLEDARRLLGDLNTSLRRRGVDAWFTAVARDSSSVQPDGLVQIITTGTVNAP